jgi:hypothetical protein
MKASRPLRDTDYAREIATAQLSSGESGRSFVAIERIYVKGAAQEEIRFSWWEGTRMMARPLDLPESELLPLIQEAIARNVFSREFLSKLRGVLNSRGA